jgi:BA14K-like protein
MRLPLLAAAVLGGSLLALPMSAPAAQFAGFATSLPVQAQSFDGSLVQKVRSRHHYRGYRRHDDAGAAAAGAIFGLALGAMIASQAAQYDRSVDWCIRHYRSYNPRTRTWVDYHGRVRYCP